GDKDEVVRQVAPLLELVRSKSDHHINGQLAVWLLRADALGANPPVPADEPYALEVKGDWRATAQAWKDLGWPYEEATALALYGCERDKREALAIFEGLGASAAARSLRKQFRAEGVKGVPRGARASTLSNPHGLTRREAQVLELLSQGLRNAAI